MLEPRHPRQLSYRDFAGNLRLSAPSTHICGKRLWRPVACENFSPWILILPVLSLAVVLLLVIVLCLLIAFMADAPQQSNRGPAPRKEDREEGSAAVNPYPQYKTIIITAVITIVDHGGYHGGCAIYILPVQRRYKNSNYKRNKSAPSPDLLGNMGSSRSRGCLWQESESRLQS